MHALRHGGSRPGSAPSLGGPPEPFDSAARVLLPLLGARGEAAEEGGDLGQPEHLWAIMEQCMDASRLPSQREEPVPEVTDPRLRQFRASAAADAERFRALRLSRVGTTATSSERAASQDVSDAAGSHFSGSEPDLAFGGR